VCGGKVRGTRIKQTKQLKIGDKSFRIAVRGFARLSTKGNQMDTCFSEGSEKTEGLKEENDDVDDIDEPVSPPACRKDEYPRLVFSGEKGITDGSCITTQVPGVIQAQQQELSQLRSQLLLLSPTRLQELVNTLKNHIRYTQQPTERERPKVQSPVTCRSMEDPVVSNGQTIKEQEGEGSLPLLPLTIPCPDHSPPPATLPTLHMSGGMVTMAEETGNNRETKRRLKHLKHEEETEIRTILQKYSKESQSILSEDLPIVLPALKEDQSIKRKPDRIFGSSYRKMRKMEVSEESSEETALGQSEVMADEDTPHKELEQKPFRTFGISANKMTNTHQTNFETGKSKTQDPLPGLTEFIEDLLNNPKHNQKTVSWKDVEEGIFRITNLQSFYKVWRDKKDALISYELLKKSIKLCEETGTLVKMPKSRSVYRLGKKSMNAARMNESVLSDSFDTFQCKLAFPIKDTGKAILNIENSFCLEIDRNLFTDVLKVTRKTDF
jgi:hypothetical protein